MKEKGASSGEQGGAVLAGLLLGGIVGAAATSSAYEKSQNRLFEECMYGKGYRLVSLPEGFGVIVKGEFDDFDRRRTAMDLVERNGVGELLAWENAKNSGDPAAYQAYLKKFPNGFFSPSAGEKVTEQEEAKKFENRFKSSEIKGERPVPGANGIYDGVWRGQMICDRGTSDERSQSIQVTVKNNGFDEMSGMTNSAGNITGTMSAAGQIEVKGSVEAEQHPGLLVPADLSFKGQYSDGKLHFGGDHGSSSCQVTLRPTSA